MDGMMPKIGFAAKRRLLKHMRECREARLRTRYLAVINLLNGRTVRQAAEVLGVHRNTVYEVARRFREQGEVGLLDRREDNGELKLDERYLSRPYLVVRSSPQDHGWKRPTWTREMLIETLRRDVGVRVSTSTMSRALRQIRARRKRPRPTVRCPWSTKAKNRRLRSIRHMLEQLSAGQVAVYQDEVDIHLNPNIGLDWMVPGQQKEVVTPGQNTKRYLAGAMNARTGELVWVEGARKNSDLFVALLRRLLEKYAHAQVIHVVLDNYRIHSSKITQQVIAEFDGRVVLHFLPPYCPNDNKIGRLWQDLHAEVTRNHRCTSITTLMRQVQCFMRRRNRDLLKRNQRRAA